MIVMECLLSLESAVICAAAQEALNQHADLPLPLQVLQLQTGCTSTRGHDGRFNQMCRLYRIHRLGSVLVPTHTVTVTGRGLVRRSALGKPMDPMVFLG